MEFPPKRDKLPMRRPILSDRSTAELVGAHGVARLQRLRVAFAGRDHAPLSYPPAIAFGDSRWRAGQEICGSSWDRTRDLVLIRNALYH